MTDGPRRSGAALETGSDGVELFRWTVLAGQLAATFTGLAYSALSRQAPA